VSALLLLLSAATAVASPSDAPVVAVEASPAVIAAARALGPGVAFFTSRAHPISSLTQIRTSAIEVGTGDVAGAKEIQALLRAGGVPVGGGAVDLMRLIGVHHLPSLFRRRPELRLFVVRARDDGREYQVVEKGGGVRLVFQGQGQEVGETFTRIRTAPSRSPFVTSFGPLLGSELAATARSRTFDAREGVRNDGREARKGHLFLVLHLQRDFSAGVGLISFLFGSGIIIKPEFEQLRVVDGARRPYPLAATYAEGRTVDLAYEVPAGARVFILQDGDTEQTLAPAPARN
jgi:hypothetical protein